MNWILVEDTLPEKEVRVLGYFPDGTEGGEKVAIAIRYNDIQLQHDFPNSTAWCFNPTHWMPLPEAP